MAQPIKRHSNGCPAKDGERCRCNAGWEASVYLAREGRKKRRTFKSKAEARSWLIDSEQAAKQGTLRATPRDTRTVAAALEAFVAGMADGTIRPKGRGSYARATLRSYEKSVRLHLIPAFGTVRVAELRRADVQDLADELLADGLAPSTASNALDPLRALYRRLEDRDEIAYNPAQRIDLPPKKSLKPARIVPAAEAAELIAALPPADRPLRAAAFYAGLRRGELQALRVRDVDLSKSEIRVERGWDQVEGAKPPKWESARTVPLLARLRDFLDQHVIETGRLGDDLIFGRTETSAFAPMTIDKRARRAWAGAELEPICLHDCRHTFASLLIDAGANAKAIQEFMGHKKITTTYDTYGHLLPGSRDEIRLRMDAYLAQHDGPTGARTGARPDFTAPPLVSETEKTA